MRAVMVMLGIGLAAVGGVIAYRAAFLAPSAAIVLTDTSMHELPNLWRVLGGLIMLVMGILFAFYATRRRA